MKALACSKRLSTSVSVDVSFHAGLREATTPAIERMGSNFGLMSDGYGEIPLSFASMPSINFFG